MTPPITLARSPLEKVTRDILTAVGVPAPKAQLVAESLVAANLRGVDSHGVRLLPHYIKQLRLGSIDAEADGRVVSESGGCLLYDAEHGFGQHVSAICCDHAVRLAGPAGLGMAIARDSNHFGAAAFWGQRISAAGMVGIVMANASPSVPPWQGKEGRFGTNPLCVAVPSAGTGGWLLDMATTTVSLNKIFKAAAGNQDTLPAGWAMDSRGVPTTDMKQALSGFPMPLGGYKGSGLQMMVEIFCGVLGGGMMSTDVGGLYTFDRKMNVSQLFLTIDVARFMPLEEFQARMEHLVTVVKSASPAQDYDEVLVAGDPEWRFEARRLREGIPIDAGTWEQLTGLASELNVPLP